MKIAFVHLGKENLGIEYLSSFLKSKDYDVRLFLDIGLFGINDNVFYIPFLEKKFSKTKILIDKIIKYQPDIVAFSVYTSTYQWSCQLANKIKKRLNTKIIFGGIHPTLSPKECIKNDFIDFVIRGEAELIFPELVYRLEHKLGYTKIKNLCYKKKNKIIKNSLRKPINLDSLPLPDKSLFENYFNFEDDYLIVTSRGCIYNCSFCCENYLNKEYGCRFFRRRSVAHVMNELKIMKKKYHFKSIMIQDNIFFTDKKWLKELLIQFKNEINTPFRCQAHVLHFDQEVAKMLKDAGCYCIEFGIQTMNQNIRKNILNRSETNQQITKAFEICDKLKLRYEIDHIFGLPLEKEQDFINATKFYSKFKYINRIKCHYLTYFPRIKIIDYALEIGSLNKEILNGINKGEDSTTFFHGGSIKKKEKMTKLENFEKLFKILPLISEKKINFILKKKLYKSIHCIPSPIIIFFQIILAIKKRDYRYIIYIKHYLRNFKKKLFR